MTNNHDDDRQLVTFLQHYQPLAPPAPPELESQLLAQVRTDKTLKLIRRRQQWRLGGAIAAALIPLVWFSSRHLFTPQTSNAQLAQLETFLEESWYCSSYECEANPWESEEWERSWEFSELASPSESTSEPATDSR
ncbi:MAG: hypothetical protein R6U67_15635 [Sodalinema sp.]|uniref:hypothetical protein n=1 Tax=Sodalinema sp. TaxID=3080550 RepID=UPI0011F664F6|nr:MAG: hypothetical protein EYR95_16350 [Phormidium sp. SL48-SHIP]